MTVDFSVVIPARDAIDTLPEVLAALERQESAPSFEILVADDGSADGTGEWLRSRAGCGRLRLLDGPPRGAAAARNAAVAAARGRWVALLGADTVPHEDWLESHHRVHRDRGEDAHLAVLGLIRPHRRLRRTAFLEVIHENGLQFGYPLIEDPEDLPFNFFYSSNLSLPRELLSRHPFDASFRDSAWEDVELGYRLKREGVRLAFAPDAVVEHDHPMTLTSFAARQERSGYSAAVLFDLHPELGEFLGLRPQGPPPPLSPARQVVLSLLTRTTGWLPWKATRLWEAILGHHYLNGLNRGWRQLHGSGRAPAPHPEGRRE